MERQVTETPQRWIILDVAGTYKVFATWTDAWRLNSGITKVEQDEDYYYFYGHSGSCYKCHKKGYGVVNSYGVVTLAKFKEKVYGMEVLEDRDDWGDLKLKYLQSRR